MHLSSELTRFHGHSGCIFLEKDWIAGVRPMVLRASLRYAPQASMLMGKLATEP